jgi:hypothetical protein
LRGNAEREQAHLIAFKEGIKLVVGQLVLAGEGCRVASQSFLELFVGE